MFAGLLCASWLSFHPPRDAQRGFQLYQSDPSGNYGGWRATAIGANHQAATNVLQGDYKEDVGVEEVRMLGSKRSCGHAGLVPKSTVCAPPLPHSTPGRQARDQGAQQDDG